MNKWLAIVLGVLVSAVAAIFILLAFIPIGPERDIAVSTCAQLDAELDGSEPMIETLRISNPILLTAKRNAEQEGTTLDAVYDEMARDCPDRVTQIAEAQGVD